MSLREVDIDIAYETGEDHEDLLNSFYIPVLERTKKYCRIAGFFSSSALLVAAEGIEALVHNDGAMQLLISPELSENDYRIIEEHGELTDDLSIFDDTDYESVKDDRLKLLAYLLDTGRLEIRIVVPKRGHSSLFHQKIGLCLDENNDSISFSGSINETAQAWLYNIEEFKVFKSWIPGQLEFLNRDLKKFNNYWYKRTDIADVYSLPDAIKKKIIDIKPDDVDDLAIMRRYQRKKGTTPNKLNLFKHQEIAVQEWIENDCKLLMEMATGTGKTRTAIGCLSYLLEKKEPLFVVVSTPQNTLSRQWLADFDALDIPVDKKLILDGTVRNWNRLLETLLWDIYFGKCQNVVVFTTHALSCKDSFTKTIIDHKNKIPILYICDEVHAIGSKSHRKALLPIYDYRIGLSATPERMYDDTGTSIIRDFFGNKSFEFSIKDALNTINPLTGEPFLNAYLYRPVFVRMTDVEQRKYAEKTRKIAALKSKEELDKDEEARLERLYEQRANIVKNADEKLSRLKEVLLDLNPALIKDTIVFCSEKQIEPVFELASDLGITRAKITESESASKVVTPDGDTERQKIIHDFEKNKLQLLVGIKCLDEGIDIKTARIGILLSNSANPREYIQRVGRVIRWQKGKPVSQIVDFIVYSETDGGLLLSKEFNRSNIIAENALNYQDVLSLFRERGLKYAD